MEKEMIGIYVKSKYTFLLSLIKFYNKKEKVVYFLEEIDIDGLNLANLNVIILNNFKKGNYLLKKYKKWEISNNLLKKLNEIEEIYLQDHITYSQFFLNNFIRKIYLLEEGILNYNDNILKNEFEKKIEKVRIFHNIKKSIIEKIKKDYKRFGLSVKIEKIYLTGLLPIPNLIKDKVEIININELWNNLSQKGKKEILDVFNIEIEKIQIFDKDDKKIYY